MSSVAFSPDGTRIVTGDCDGTTKVWDARTGKPLVELKGHAGTVNSVAFSPDGTRVVAGGGAINEAEVKVWDADRDAPPRFERPHGLSEQRGIQPGRQACRHRER